MDWKEKAILVLKDSLIPVPTELNELDWKSGLSPKKERLAQHISAFANLKGGGMFVFGVNNDGSCFSISQSDAEEIVKQLGNIAKNNLAYSIKIEHAILEYNGYSLLFVHIPEQVEKPVYLRGTDLFNSYCRSAGQTVKMSHNQIKLLISSSEGIFFERQIAMKNMNAENVLTLLNYRKMFELLDKNVPSSPNTILNKMNDLEFCKYESGYWHITNLGAILFANDITQFEGLRGKSVIVRKYMGTNNREMEFEQVGRYGYAVGFEGLVDFIMLHTQNGEKREVKRESKYIYPKVAIREFVANALIHQDFAISGMSIAIEIFSDRLSVTNPGAPLNDINRLIDLPPNSRNEILANMMLLLRFCERRGSGIDYAIEAIEKHGLPAVKFTRSEQHTRIFLFPSKCLSEMTKEERILACYQHACLIYEDNKSINNTSVRERFRIEKNSSFVASRIISDTLESGLIKISDETNISRKFANYIPFYG
ncbi:MAG: putative DNA binding domain-containing protein [Prevotellaceae bacterium]|jgi:predicted HTH transcriptional regulator|nr:putative DNA binding domain-containing protein [Prevotellaceae bacterium]